MLLIILQLYIIWFTVALFVSMDLNIQLNVCKAALWWWLLSYKNELKFWNIFF